jgi:flagellar motor protein MotB
MTTISTFLTGWLIGAAATAATAPLPSYDVLGDRVATERASTARASSAQEQEKDRQREQREQQRQQQQEQRERQQQQQQEQREQQQQQREEQREAARAQRDAQREKWKVQVREQQERSQAQRDRQRGEWVEIEGERIVKSFSVGKAGSLLLHNISGDVIVTAGGGSEIKVQAIKKAKGRSQDEARQQLDNVVLTMQEAGGGRVDIRVEPRGRESRAWIDFNVTVPYEASAEIHSVSGDLSVTGVKGEVRAETVSGDVKGTGLTRLAAAKSVSGDVVLNNTESDGTLVLSAVSGDVTATNVKARAIEVSAVSGDTVLSQCNADRAQVSTVNGDITYSGWLSKAGRYELKTHSGDIVLHHQGSAFEVAASTFSGDIKFDQPLPGTVKANTNRYGPGRSVRGAVGGGGAYLELTTFSGDIIVGKE